MVQVFFHNGDWSRFKVSGDFWATTTAHKWLTEKKCPALNVAFRAWPSNSPGKGWMKQIPDKTWATMPARFGSEPEHETWWMSPRIPIGWKPGMDAEEGRQLAMQLWEKAAHGYFNPMWESVLKALRESYFVRHNLGHLRTVWRPFWECNGACDIGSPHNIYSSSYACARTTAEIATVKAGQEECIKTIKQVFPGAFVHWCPLKKGQTTESIARYCPDNADIIGPDYYDAWPANRTVDEWEKNIRATARGGPVGLQQWLEFCKSKNKPLGLGEWGIGLGVAGEDAKVSGGDNGLFIQKMFEFFSRNKEWMAYEIYFNTSTHLLRANKSRNPMASEAYHKAYAVSGRP